MLVLIKLIFFFKWVREMVKLIEIVDLLMFFLLLVIVINLGVFGLVSKLLVFGCLVWYCWSFLGVNLINCSLIDCIFVFFNFFIIVFWRFSCLLVFVFVIVIFRFICCFLDLIVIFLIVFVFDSFLFKNGFVIFFIIFFICFFVSIFLLLC